MTEDGAGACGVLMQASVVAEKLFRISSGVPRNFFPRGGVVQQIQFRTEDRENGDLEEGSPLVRGSGCCCNLVQEISFHIVKFS